MDKRVKFMAQIYIMVLIFHGSTMWSAILYFFVPEGALWNGRLVPFFNLAVYVLWVFMSEISYFGYVLFMFNFLAACSIFDPVGTK